MSRVHPVNGTRRIAAFILGALVILATIPAIALATDAGDLDEYILPKPKIPLKVAVCLPDSYIKTEVGFVSANFLVNRGLKVGEAMATTLRRNLPKIFEVTAFPDGCANLDSFDLVVRPEFISGENSAGAWSGGGRVTITQSIALEGPDHCFKISARSSATNRANWSVEHQASKGLASTFRSIMIQLLADPLLAAYVETVSVRKALPSDLAFTAGFDDGAGIIPNSAIDAGERSDVVMAINNKGRGKGYAIKAEVKSTTRAVGIAETTPLGEIPPGESREIRIPLSADLNLADGQAEFTINVRESRGYDAKPQILRVPTRHMDRPGLTVASYEINDGIGGMGEGNGNGSIESGETIELVVFVKNEGAGSGVGVLLALEEAGPGIEILGKEAALGVVRRGETARGKLAFRVPRTYAAEAVKVKLGVSDARTGREPAREFALGFKSRAPVLAYRSRILRSGAESQRVYNGDAFEIEITPENRGALAAHNVTLSVAAESAGLQPVSVTVGDLGPASSAAPLRFKVRLPRSFAGSSLPVGVRLDQADFAGHNATLDIAVETLTPKLTYSAAIGGRLGGGIVEQGEQARVTLQVGNQGTIEARDLKVSLAVPGPDVRIIGPKEGTIAQLDPKSVSEAVTFEVMFTRRVTAGPVPLQITVSQADFPAVTFSHEVTVQAERATVVEVPPEAPKDSQPSAAGAASMGPVIALAGPPDRLRTYEEWVDLSGTAADAKGIAALQAKVNGKPVKLDIRAASGIGQQQFSARLPLEKGENTIEVVARNLDNATSSQTRVVFGESAEGARTRIAPLAAYSDVDAGILALPVGAQTLGRSKWAVVLGVESYRAAPAVSFARRDAQAFKELMQRRLGIPAENIFALYDDEVTLGALRDLVEDALAARVQAGDTVYFFFAGHGVPDVGDGTPYILPADGKPSNPRRTAYPLSDLYAALGTLPAQRVFAFLDACFSGSAARQPEQRLLVEGIRPVIPAPKTPELAVKNLVVFAATEPSQVSNAYPSKQHGLFTYYLLRGLLGMDSGRAGGSVSIGDLGRYLRSEVSETARREFGPALRQEPVVRGSEAVNSAVVLE